MPHDSTIGAIVSAGAAALSLPPRSKRVRPGSARLHFFSRPRRPRCRKGDNPLARLDGDRSERGRSELSSRRNQVT